jgi:predicted alpha/beta superfamily hydrolase
MKRLFLTAMLVTPVVLAGWLFFMAKAKAGENAEKAAAARAAMGSRLSGAGVTLVRKGEDGVAREVSAGAGMDASVSAPGAGERRPDAQEPKMVRPESLEQGYILVVKDLSGLASSASPIYLASSFNGWDPSDRKQVLTGRSDLRWQIVMPKSKVDAGIAFKFTRGNWDMCEVAADLSDTPNRSLPLVDAGKLKPGEQPVFEFEVHKWADQRPSAGARPDLDPYHELKVTGNVKRLQVSGGGVPMLRDCLVWLPPGYDDPANKDRRYPVLYLQDGQNVFEHLPSVPGEWGVDEAATRLIAEGKVEPLIIVAVPHGGKARASEYAPVPVLDGVPARGKQYVEFLVTEVLPRVERAFRVKDGAENTAIGGASLGGLIALYAAAEQPETFGGVLVESMAGVSGKRAAFEALKGKGVRGRVWFAFGAKEGGTDPKDAANNAAYVEGAKAFVEQIKSSGGAGAGGGGGGGGAGPEVRFVLDEAGVHDEKTWARRFPEALQFLFPAKKP